MIYVVETQTLEPYEDWGSTRVFDNKLDAWAAYKATVAIPPDSFSPFGDAVYLKEVKSGQSIHEGRTLTKSFVRGHGTTMNYNDRY